MYVCVVYIYIYVCVYTFTILPFEPLKYLRYGMKRDES